MGNFFILRANVPKMFTDNSAKLHNVHSVNSRVALISKCRTTEFCWYYYVLNCEFVWTTRVLLSLPGNILTRVRTAATNVVFIYLFVCVCVTSLLTRLFLQVVQAVLPQGTPQR